MIYFDNAATTPVLPCAWDAMQAAPEGNPSSSHAAGREAKAALEKARATIARCINCDPSEVYFTSGATEACNWAVKSICSTADSRHRSMIASTTSPDTPNWISRKCWSITKPGKFTTSKDFVEMLDC